MELSFECLAELPKLAWCVELHRNCPFARVNHGLGVETSPNAFCEGAWSGDFGSMNFVEDDFFSGSGAMVLDGKLVFACPITRSIASACFAGRTRFWSRIRYLSSLRNQASNLTPASCFTTQ